MIPSDNPREDLIALAAMSDCDIDTSDAAELAEIKNPAIGKYSDIDFRGYDVRSIANWCIRKADEQGVKVSNLWLNKIVSLIYTSALEELNVLLTSARLEAWEYGPVFREIYLNYPTRGGNLFSKYNVVKRSKEVATDAFAREDLEIFNTVWDRFGHLSGARLTEITHRSGTPWERVWSDGGAVNPGMVIDVATILGRSVGQGNGRY